MDAVFIEALPDVGLMKKAVQEVQAPIFANIIEGGLTQNISAAELSEMGFCAAMYPISLVASHIKSIRNTLDELKRSFTVGAPPQILTFEEVTAAVGFDRYWQTEGRYAYDENGLLIEKLNGVKHT